ncbi:ATP-binding protein [Haliea sp.]
MKQTVVAVTGISGVGKTTFLRNAAKEIQFQHLTAGSLIATARATPDNSREELRHADLEENQRLLIHGFAQARDSEAALVVLDGHVIIDSEKGITLIPSQVFADLEVNLIVHLEADPIKISQHRAGDANRSRPQLPAKTLFLHQQRSKQHARDLASDLGIGFLEATPGDCKTFISHIRSLLWL